MKIFNAGLCLLPSLLLVVFFFGSTRSSTAACRGSACKSGFACPGPYKCTCARSASGDYELLCPGVGETSVLSANILPGRYIHIQCTYSTHWADYSLLDGLKVGPVTAVNFRLCPLPNMSLSELTRAIGVNSTSSLLFQSYRNLSNTLERKHLKGLGNVTRLLLSSNGLTDLPEDLLQDLVNLTWLDLRGNKVHLHRNFFQSVPNLDVLELGNNDLKVLEPGVFGNLTKLRFLNLWKNQLKNLTRNVFSNLTNLEQLDVSSNGITSFPPDVFLDLHKLQKLNLYANNFSSIPEGLFSATPNLQTLRLYDNRQTLKLPNSFLANLTKLQEAYLMRSNMSFIPENVFWGSSALINISLQENSLKELPDEVFRDQTALKTLDISYNQLARLQDHLFRNLAQLEFLRLGNNRLQNISRDVFHGLNKLELLDLEHNRLSFIDSSAFSHLDQLKHARLSHNRLSFINEEFLQDSLPYMDIFGKKSPFRDCINLEYLYLANNSITEIFADWRIVLTKLRTLDLSYNRIEHLLVQDVQFIPDEMSVDLRHNNISVINLQGVEALAIGQIDGPHSPRRSKRNVRVLLEGNPLNCDCRAYELIRYFEGKLQPEVYTLVTLVSGNLTCDSPETLKTTLATAVNSYDVTCRLEDGHGCPAACDCLLRRASWGLIINCTERGLTEIPAELPRIEYTNHTELILDGNFIERLPNVTYRGYENITHLQLSRNNIAVIDSGFISPQIQVLTIDNNNITRLSSNLVKFLSNSTQVSLLLLHNNPWHCDCNARDLLGLIQLKFKQIPFLANVTCWGDKRLVSKLSVSDLCPASLAVIISCIVVAAFGILIGSVAALYYRYHREVKVWLYSHHFCLWFVTEQELDKDKIYDAFISYSHKDEDFVVNTLVPELESGEAPFKLCLHYRDWIAGEWIPNQIARSVEDSRRTLVVLSPNFLESVWGRMEFRAAHKQALCEGRARVIVVLYGDVGPTDQLDPELKAYISMNTYVKWGDPWFWGKLKYALPHPPSLVKNNLNLLKRRGSRKEKNYIDDKLELIHTLDSPTTPPGATTPPAEQAVTTMETVTAIPNGNIGNGQIKLLA